MKDFNPIALIAIAQEFLGPWFWFAAAAVGAVALAWLLAIVSGRLWRVGVGRAFRPAALVGLVAGVACVLWLPGWTGATLGQLQGLVDYVAVLAAGVGAFAAATVALMPLVAGIRGKPKH